MADRSLSFFVKTYNDINTGTTDPKTGMKVTNEEYQYNIKKYKEDDPFTATGDEKKTVNYNVVNSGQAEGQFVNYLGNSSTNDYRAYEPSPEHESDISYGSIISWTQQNHPSMKLKYQHFAYLKDFRVYPANRLMVLRRFGSPAPHDLFNFTGSPLHTMVTYYDFEKLPINISYNEKWTTFEKPWMEVIADIIGIDIASIPGVGSAFGAASGSALGQDISYLLAKKLGFLRNDVKPPYGDPSLIYEAAIRDGNTEELKSGLESDISITFETTYVLREINGVDAKSAMLDILANCINMGTSAEKFYMSGGLDGGISEVLRNMEQGNIDALITQIKDGISDLIGKVATSLAEGASAVANDPSKALDTVFDGVKKLGGDILQQRYARYRWHITGAIGALTGNHTAPWHITLGNPKFPWFTCGNLYIDSMSVEPGGEMAYNDMFTELKVKCTLKAGRTMGAHEISSLFNHGRGRIYDSPDKIQTIYSPDNAEVKIGGTEANPTSAPSSANGNTSIDNTNHVNTDQLNDLKGSNVPDTSFNLNNQDTDNNLSGFFVP